MAYTQTIDHCLLDPKGRVGRAYRLSTANSNDREAARKRSIKATGFLRQKLSVVEVKQAVSGRWCHIVSGRVVASFDTVGEAVAAL